MLVHKINVPGINCPIFLAIPIITIITRWCPEVILGPLPHAPGTRMTRVFFFWLELEPEPETRARARTCSKTRVGIEPNLKHPSRARIPNHNRDHDRSPDNDLSMFVLRRRIFVQNGIRKTMLVSTCVKGVRLGVSSLGHVVKQM